MLAQSDLFHPSPDSGRQVEYTWILALGLKALNIVIEVSATVKLCCAIPTSTRVFLQSPSSEEVVKALLSGGLVPAIVKLASKPTRFSQKWHLADLEVHTKHILATDIMGATDCSLFLRS